MSDYYWGNSKATGTCISCKRIYDKPEYAHTKKGQHVKKPLTQLWAKVGWFRGDDDVLGVVCPDCKKNKRIEDIGGASHE